jgi:hypothetical protein
MQDIGLAARILAIVFGLAFVALLLAKAYVAMALGPFDEPYDPGYQHVVRWIVSGWQGALFLILVTAAGVVCWVRGFVLRD